MDITIVGRHLGITDRFENFVQNKAEKVDHLADKATALEVKVSRHSEQRGAAQGDKVELMLIGPGPIIRAESEAGDKYSAFDLALDKLLERVRRAKDRKKVHRGGKRHLTSLGEAAGSGFSSVAVTPADLETLENLATGTVPIAPVAEVEDEEEAYCPVVIRQKVFPTTVVSVDDAVDQMELVGHDFYLFVDAETNRPSVVYRRKGWDYGVIGLDLENVEELPRIAAAP